MSTVILRGTDRKIETTISMCEKINKLKENKADPKTPLNVEGVVLYLEDIKYAMYDVEKDKELQKEQSGINSDKYYKDISGSFLLEIKMYANETKSKKIEFNLKVASFYCYTFTGLWLKEWVKENDLLPLQNILSKELETEKLLVDPRKYKNIFKVNDIITGVDSLANSKYTSRSAPLRIMESYIREVYLTLKLI